MLMVIGVEDDLLIEIGGSASPPGETIRSMGYVRHAVELGSVSSDWQWSMKACLCDLSQSPCHMMRL